MIAIGRQEIASMIPHQGAMCLLDQVLSWDPHSICCLSRRHRCPDNPLRRADGTLGAAACVELAAQAMAVHAQLLAGTAAPPAPGYLASVRDLSLRKVLLDGIEGDLVVTAICLAGDARGAAYRFALESEGTTLLSGRATVLLRT